MPNQWYCSFPLLYYRKNEECFYLCVTQRTIIILLEYLDNSINKLATVNYKMLSVFPVKQYTRLAIKYYNQGQSKNIYYLMTLIPQLLGYIQYY